MVLSRCDRKFGVSSHLRAGCSWLLNLDYGFQTRRGVSHPSDFAGSARLDLGSEQFKSTLISMGSWESRM